MGIRFADILLFAFIIVQTELAYSNEHRDRLSVEAFFSPEKLGSGPIDNRYFLPIGKFEQAKHPISGAMVIPETQGWKFGTFPAVTIEFLASGDALIPAVQDIVISATSRTRWSLIFSPGRVWSETGDKGYSRASFPFVLAGKTRSASHNGIATFLFNDTTVSALIFQIVQESHPYDKFNTWGRIPVSFNRKPIANSNGLVLSHKRELEERLPLLPLSDLESQFGDKGARATKEWPVDAMDPTASGLVVDGKIFASECKSRFGPFPYCAQMRHGVYSVSKTLGALLAMLRLSQKYGDEVFDLKIKDYVTVTAKHDGWSDVTFGDALNMATGIGDAPVEFKTVFENIPPYSLFSGQLTSAQKLATAFTSANYPWGPGEKFRYRDMDTFMLAAAMGNFLRSQEGETANLWDMVIEEVLRPIGLMHAPMIHTIEPDGSRGVPILNEGYFPTIHEIIKISLLFQNDGKHQGKQLLSSKKLDEAFYRTSVRGNPFPTGLSRFAGFTYHMGLWHVPIDLGECKISVSRMSGWGGNAILLMPSGIIAFTIRNKGIGVDDKLAAVAHIIDSQCD